MLKAELDALKAANSRTITEATRLVAAVNATTALIAKIVPTPAPAPTPTPTPTPTGNILWQDDIQTSADFTREFFASCQFMDVYQNNSGGSDAFGASLSRVRDPAGGTGWAIRHFLNAGAGQWGRAQLSISSAGIVAFAKQLADKGEVYVSQEMFLPEALVAGDPSKSWLSMQDFHVHTIPNGEAGLNRLDTWPGFFMGSPRLNNCPAGRMISRHMLVFSQPTPPFPVGRWATLTTRYPWPARGVSGNLDYYFDNVKVAEVPIVARPDGQTVLEFMLKLYGEGPWNQKPLIRYTRNVRIGDGLMR